MTAGYAIYGAGGFAREVAPLVQNPRDVLFVSDRESDLARSPGGRSIIDFAELCTPGHRARSVLIAIAAPAARMAIAAKCETAGLAFGTIAASSHRRLERVHIGEGAILCDHTMVTSDVIIGRHFHLNIYAYVAHDVRIGDFVTFGPKVACNGNVEIGDRAFIGAGAILREGTPERPLRVGPGAVIGMGAVVTKDVPAGATVYGNPARIVGTSSA